MNRWNATDHSVDEWRYLSPAGDTLAHIERLLVFGYPVSFQVVVEGMLGGSYLTLEGAMQEVERMVEG